VYNTIVAGIHKYTEQRAITIIDEFEKKKPMNKTSLSVTRV